MQRRNRSVNGAGIDGKWRPVAAPHIIVIYLNIASLLVFKPTIFDFIQRTEPGKDGEFWLTDSIELMRRSGQKVFAFLFKGVRYDVGTFESLMEADRLEWSEK